MFWFVWLLNPDAKAAVVEMEEKGGLPALQPLASDVSGMADVQGNGLGWIQDPQSQDVLIRAEAPEARGGIGQAGRVQDPERKVTPALRVPGKLKGPAGSAGITLKQQL